MRYRKLSKTVAVDEDLFPRADESDGASPGASIFWASTVETPVIGLTATRVYPPGTLSALVERCRILGAGR